MAGGLTTNELLAEQHLAGAPSREAQALAHSFANNISGRLPGHPRTAVGEVLMHVAGDIGAFLEVFASNGLDPLKAIGVVTKVLAAAGAELYTEGMSAEDVAARVAAAIQESLWAADEDKSTGRYERYGNDEEFLASFDNIPAVNDA